MIQNESPRTITLFLYGAFSAIQFFEFCFRLVRCCTNTYHSLKSMSLLKPGILASFDFLMISNLLKNKKYYFF